LIASAVTAQEALADCKCRANKQQYEHGQFACIMGKLARCDMVLNVPSWTPIADQCPQTRLRQSIKLASVGNAAISLR
jgi:hypothetical protein